MIPAAVRGLELLPVCCSLKCASRCSRYLRPQITRVPQIRHWNLIDSKSYACAIRDDLKNKTGMTYMPRDAGSSKVGSFYSLLDWLIKLPIERLSD